MHYSTLKSTVVQYSSWHAGSGIKCTGKETPWIEEQEEGGDGRVLLCSTQLLFRRYVASDSRDPVDCSPPGSSVHGFSRQEYWSELSFPSPGDLPRPGVKPLSPALAGGFFTTGPPRKPTLPSTAQRSTPKHYRF